MAASSYTVKIGGVAVNVIAGSLNVQNQIGQRSTGSLSVWSNVGTFWNYGTQVQVLDETNTVVYSGYVNKDKASKDGGAPQGSGYLTHAITLMDNAYRADKRLAFKTYLNQTAGFIIKDLIGAYLSAEGVTYTTASVSDGPTITEVIWNGKQISTALTWLAQQAGYWWDIDINGVLFFQPYGGTSAPFVLDGTQIDASSVSVEYGNDMYINTQYAKGSYAEKGSKAAQLHEQFHGNSLTRNFTLSYPVNTLYQILLNGVDQTSLTLSKGSTGGDWYYARSDSVIAQDPGQTVLAAGDTLDVYYTGRFPVLAVAKNPALITAQQTREGGTGTGIVESIYTNTKVHTLPAAFQIAGALLGHYGQDTTVLTFLTRTKGLAPGQLLTVNLTDFGLSNKSMLISGVGITDQDDQYNIWFHVTAVGSPVESAQWQTYWQNLMNQSADPADLSDTSETFLALLLDTVITLSPTLVDTRTQYTCPICGNSTLVGGATPIIC